MAHCPHPKLSSEDQCDQDSLLTTYHLPMIGMNASTNMTDASSNSMSTQETTLARQQICSNPSHWRQGLDLGSNFQNLGSDSPVQGKKQDREYFILLPSDRTLCRNRRFIRILRYRRCIITTPYCKSALMDNYQAAKLSNLQRSKSLRFAPNKCIPSD
ncbi:unnamed protein product [Lepeophtheirus salmonis]|uniref:(salmon louse) hypothetical protein n=1 Tax=Lepeophtheirus salmonis TaxID=72036 RepID=A0A7R8CW60_LEPSM|nr:unnamed protein product [Lepeophtheirus salmonis]CAF2919180.1 unnamed protein product [Lepeophtheirus salmonis]